MTKLIAFCGYAGSGKDTAAGFLGGINIKFADPIKKQCYEYLVAIGVNEILAKEYVDNSKDVLIQELGMKSSRDWQKGYGDFMRSFDEDYFVKIFTNSCQNQNNLAHWVVNTDLRFPNEHKAITDMGGVIVKVTNSRVTPDLSHPSEQHIATFAYDHLIENDGSLEELQKKVKELEQIIWMT